MNKNQIRKMPDGSIVRLAPPVLHFDNDGNKLLKRDDDWIMKSPRAQVDRVELMHIGGGGYRHELFFDRIIRFQEADLHYRLAPKQGMLILNTQVVVIGDGLVKEQILVMLDRHSKSIRLVI